jgi:hypothetical protein
MVIHPYDDSMATIRQLTPMSLAVSIGLKASAIALPPLYGSENIQHFSPMAPAKGDLPEILSSCI